MTEYKDRGLFLNLKLDPSSIGQKITSTSTDKNLNFVQFYSTNVNEVGGFGGMKFWMLCLTLLMMPVGSTC